MMLIYIDMMDGMNVAGRTEVSNLSLVVADSWIRVSDPAVTAITTAPIYNNEGQVQLVDGTWQNPNAIRDASKVNMVVQGSKFLAFDVEEMIISKEKVKSVRPMKRDEIERYDACLKAAKRANTKLELTTGINN